MRILAISGSLQRRSTNTRLLEAARSIASPGVDVVLYRALEQIPHFNPDLTDPTDGPVAELRREIAAADAVLIATPEYAHGLPGALKNALDWIVGSGELYSKRVAALTAAPSKDRGHSAREMLERTLRALGAEVAFSSSVTMSGDDAVDISAATRAALDEALQVLTRSGPT